MDLTEVSLMYHVAAVLLFLWFLSAINFYHISFFFISLIYLYLVHERYVMRLKKELQFRERKHSNHRRVLSESETVRWMNYAVEKLWPICIEQIASQKILLPIIPWFLDKYKPWTAKKAVVEHLYLGRNAPIFTEIKVHHRSLEDDHLVLELGMNFLTADDMSTILAVKLRKAFGFGLWTKLHLTSLHIEGKVLIGVKFIRSWPFLSRLRLCFAEPPFFQMSARPLFSHGPDVAELPGIAGWLDKLLSTAFEQTLVEPNMLVVDMEKFVSPQPGNSRAHVELFSDHWFSVEVVEPVAHVKVEVLEGSDMKPSDIINGLADPFVKGQLGSYRFKTKTERKTLTPKWNEEFKIPIVSWESKNVITIQVYDKDNVTDDYLGDCSIDVADFRDGRRHDLWLALQNVNTGRLHIAVTVEENLKKDDDHRSEQEKAVNGGSLSSALSAESPADNFEAIHIEGQKEAGVWIHHPGVEVSQTWEQRKGKGRRIEVEIHGHQSKQPGKSPIGGFFAAIFHHNSKKDDQTGGSGKVVSSPHANVRAINKTEVGVKLVVHGQNSPQASEISKTEVKTVTKVVEDHQKSDLHQVEAEERQVPIESDSSDDDESRTRVIASPATYGISVDDSEGNRELEKIEEHRDESEEDVQKIKIDEQQEEGLNQR